MDSSRHHGLVAMAPPAAEIFSDMERVSSVVAIVGVAILLDGFARRVMIEVALSHIPAVDDK